VAGVVQELLLVLGALVQSFKHRVEGLREQRHVIRTVAHFHPPGEVLLADHLRGLAQTPEGIEQTAGHQASDQRGSEQRPGGHQRVGADRGEHVLLLITGVPADQ
jgi:hypothetical protein